MSDVFMFNTTIIADKACLTFSEYAVKYYERFDMVLDEKLLEDISERLDIAKQGQFVMSYTKLVEYGAIPSASTPADAAKKLKALGLIKDQDFQLDNSNEYQLTPEAFKIGLIRSKKEVSDIARKYIEIEGIVPCYMDYRIAHVANMDAIPAEGSDNNFAILGHDDEDGRKFKIVAGTPAAVRKNKKTMLGEEYSIDFETSSDDPLTLRKQFVAAVKDKIKQIIAEENAKRATSDNEFNVALKEEIKDAKAWNKQNPEDPKPVKVFADAKQKTEKMTTKSFPVSCTLKELIINENEFLTREQIFEILKQLSEKKE